MHGRLCPHLLQAWQASAPTPACSTPAHLDGPTPSPVMPVARTASGCAEVLPWFRQRAKVGLDGAPSAAQAGGRVERKGRAYAGSAAGALLCSSLQLVLSGGDRLDAANRPPPRRDQPDSVVRVAVAVVLLVSVVQSGPHRGCWLGLAGWEVIPAGAHPRSWGLCGGSGTAAGLQPRRGIPSV